jgi:2-phospho-L-lactate guanylyltransferase
LIPVTELATAKSRMSLAAEERRHLVLAMLGDVLAAVKQSPDVGEVVICTSDPQILDEYPRESIWLTSRNGDLNADIGEALIEPWLRDKGRPTAVVVADLPCLRPDDLGTVLSAAAQGRMVFVASCDGGTTILAARDPSRLVTRFGSGSAAAHRRWYRDVSSEVGVGCRLDMDTVDALAWGHRIGLGRRTAHVVTALGGPRRLLSRGELQLQAGKVGTA